MGKPLTLSLIIPAYNEETHLKACLDSVAQQFVMPLEVIVINNNSTDATAEIAASYPFVTLLHEKRQGIAYARDAGYNVAKGDIIGRIDADTILPRHWVRHALAFMENHQGNHILTGGCYFYDLRPGKFFGWLQAQFAYRANRFILGYYIAWGSNMALPRALWKRIRSDMCYQADIHEDIDLTIHAHRAGYKVTYQAGWRVGIDSRIFTRHSRGKQLAYMKMWPQTLRVHHLKGVWLGEVGAYFVHNLYYPIIVVNAVGSFFYRLSRIFR